MPERVLVTGDREWKSYKTVLWMLWVVRETEGIEVLIEGEARGADKMSRQAALELGVPEENILKFPADWNKYGRAAGPIRNRQQFNEGKPTLVIAFHLNIAKSKGTADMMDVAVKAGVRTVLVDFEVPG